MSVADRAVFEACRALKGEQATAMRLQAELEVSKETSNLQTKELLAIIQVRTQPPLRCA